MYGARPAMPGGTVLTYIYIYFFHTAPMSVWVTPQNETWATSPTYFSFLLPSQPHLLFHQPQKHRTQPRKYSPFSPAAHHTLVLDTLGGGFSAVSEGWIGRRSHSLSLQRGYLWLSQTGHLYLLLRCEKHQMDTEGTGGPSPTWFNYFYFNPRPLLPPQCLVNTTF